MMCGKSRWIIVLEETNQALERILDKPLAELYQTQK